MSVANRITASLPFSLILRGWFASPRANSACPAARACTTFAPPPGTMKPFSTVTPSSSKKRFSRATRCWA